MHNCHRVTTTIMPSSSSKASSSSSSSNPNPNYSSSNAFQCKHSPSATLDLLILILVLFSGTFLVSSYFNYLFTSLSLLLDTHGVALSLSFSLPLGPALAGLLVVVLAGGLFLLLLDACLCPRSRRCDRPGCKGMKKAMEFDLQLQTEECLRSRSAAVLDIDRLPWKGGTETNPDYDCLRAELKKMAPPNGRAVLLFRTRCGCPVAKLQGWGPKKARRHKKSLASVAVNADCKCTPHARGLRL